MCEICSEPRHRPSGAKMPRLRLGFVALLMAASIALIAVAPGRGDQNRGAPPSGGDLVFVRDIAATGARGRELGARAARTCTGNVARAGAALARANAGLLTALGTRTARSPGRAAAPVPPRSLRAALVAQAQEQLIVARIESATGSARRLKQLAQDARRNALAVLTIVRAAGRRTVC